MCDPTSIGLVVAGTALTINAQHQRQKAMANAADDAQNAEILRQNAMKKDSAAALDPAMQNATRATQDAALADAAAKREAAYGDATTLPGDQGTASYQAPSEAASYGQPKIIQETADKVRAKNNAEVASVGDARARLASYGDVGLGNQMINQNAGNTINMLSNFSRQSSALLPGEIQAAMASKAGTARTQEMLGTALSMYGGAGAPGLSGGASYGAALGGSANAGATVGGYSGNLAGFVPSAGAAGESAAAAAQPGLMGGLYSNLSGTTMPWWQQQAARTSTSGIGSLLANRR